MRTGERYVRYVMSASLWLSGTPASPDYQAESPIQVQLHLEKRPLDPVFHGYIEGAFGEIHHEALAPGLELVRGPGRRLLRGPLLDRLSQRPPEAQLYLDPRARHPVPERNGVGGAGEFRRKVLKHGVPIAEGAMVLTHEGSLRCKTGSLTSDL